MNKRALWIALGMGLFILLAAWNYASIRFRNKLDHFLDRDSEAYRNYTEYSRQFPSSGENWVVILDFQRQPGYADFVRVDSLTAQLSRLEGIDRCYSITSMQMLRRSLLGIARKKLLKLGTEAQFEHSWKKLDEYPDVQYKFIAQDQRATCIYLEIDSLASSDLAGRVRREVESFDFPHVRYAGSALFTQQARETMQQEMKVLGMVAAAALLLVLFILFRSFKSVLLTTFTLAFNVSAIYLLFVFTGHEVNTLTFTVPMLITILSFSDLVHILYAAGQAHELDWASHVRAVMVGLRAPLVLTSLTTALAFAVFMGSSVPEIMDFSWMSCLGIVWAYLAARYLFPELLIAVGKIKAPREVFGALNGVIERSLRKSAVLVRLGVLAVLAMAGWSVLSTQISYDPYRNGSEKLLGGQLMLNERFGGIRSVEVMLSDIDSIDSLTFRKVEEIENYLMEEYGCTSVFSVNTVVRRLNRFSHFGRTAFYRLPEHYDASFMKDFWKYRKDLGLREAVSADGHTLKIVGRLRDSGSRDAMERTEALETWLRNQPWKEKVYVGGHSLLQDRAMHRVTEIILLGVFLSLLMAVLVGAFYYRKARLALALLLPNILPLLCALVFMESFQLNLDPFTAMALSIIFGLSIDDTIYILGTYMEKRKSGVTLTESVRWNLFPVCATSLLLAIGFGIFALSELPSTRSIGILVPIILVIAVLSDLFLLPPLLKWAVKKAS